MKHIVSTEITKARVARWILNAKPLETNHTWTERRLAIEFGGHTYLVTNGQVFPCSHCGHYDVEWKSTEVISFFKENFGAKEVEIEVTCSVAVVQK